MRDELEVLRGEMRRKNIVRTFKEKEAQVTQSAASVQQEAKSEKKGQLTLGEFEHVSKPQSCSSVPARPAPQNPASEQRNAAQTTGASPQQGRCPNSPPKIRIVADNREFNSGVARDLLRAGAFVEPKQLEVGDYILSDRCCAERKESGDFVQSIIDGRLFEQMIAMRSAYQRPLLIIEGPDITAVRNMNPLAIYSAVASISVDFGIPILQTRDAKETANLLYAIARREQADVKRDVAIRGEKPQMSLAERQQFIVESLPDISSVLAKRLLCKFGTVKRIMGAEPEALERVEGIGPVTAEEINRIANEIYPECKDGRLRKKTENRDPRMENREPGIGVRDESRIPNLKTPKEGH